MISSVMRSLDSWRDLDMTPVCPTSPRNESTALDFHPTVMFTRIESTALEVSSEERNEHLMNATTAPRYLTPDRFTLRVFNPIVTRLVKLGFSVRGARELHVRGRSSGEWRTVPVNLLHHDGATYLVAPRGHTQWVRNLRAAGEGRLRSGRAFEDFTAVELDDADKAPILRAYLEQWAFEVGKFFEGVDVDSPDERLAEVAPGFPVFRVSIH
jgi:deazaflavin-dependent oxidoreductase (nitroreductase family)